MKCPVPTCSGYRAVNQILCRWHWFRVPSAMRNEIRESQLRRRKWTAADLEHHRELVRTALLVCKQSRRPSDDDTRAV